MTKALAFLKKPILFQNKFYIYPPSINEALDNKSFNSYVSLLTLNWMDLEDAYLDKTKDDDQSNIDIPSSFDYLMGNSYYSSEFKKVAEDAFEFFLHQKANILPAVKKIVLGNLEDIVPQIQGVEDLIIIDENNYEDFQNVIRECLGHKTVEPKEDESGLHPKILRMKRLSRQRDRVKQRQEAKNGPTFETILASICCMGIGITPLNIGEISYAAIFKIMNTFQKKEKYEIDTHSVIMGADPKKVKLEYWIKEDKEEK